MDLRPDHRCSHWFSAVRSPEEKVEIARVLHVCPENDTLTCDTVRVRPNRR